MTLFLAELGRSLPEGVPAVLVLDRAGWQRARALKVPATVTLVPLPPYSPEPGPVERIWLYLRERFLSLRVFKDDLASVDACCEAWNRLIADRIRSLCHQPCIATLTSSAQRYQILTWSTWRRRHQQRAKQCHWKRRIKIREARL